MLRLITAPAAEPLSTAEAKTHLRISGTADDTYIAALIVAARQVAEQRLGRPIITQTWELVLDQWPDDDAPITIPAGGVTAVTWVKYYNAANVQTTWTSTLYEVALREHLSALQPVYGQAWPSIYQRWDSVQIRFVAGYADAASVPAAVRQWMLVQLAHLFEHREAALDFAVFANPFIDGLLDPYRCQVIA